jgi:hypothetical protein
MKILNSIIGFAFILTTLALGACGGGGSSDGGGGGSTTTTTLSGTAAAGAPIIGQVTVKGSLGNSKSALIEADGSYNVDVTGLTAPYRLRAVGTVGGRTVKLFSYAEAADVDGTVNITPFTDLIVANAAQQIAESFFDSQTTTSLDATVVAEQEAALQDKLQNVFNALGVSTAVDLLHTTFSADHSGLDAVLDAVRVEVDTSSNIATITNLVENTTLSDNILDSSDNTATLAVSDAGALTTAVSDTQSIATLTDNMTQAFANGLPAVSAIQDYFADDFYETDSPKSAFLSDITTDPTLVGLSFSAVSVSDLDSIMGTAKISFHVSIDGFIDPDPVNWYVARDSIQGWQFKGDQRIADIYFEFHCNDNNGNDNQSGDCGINTQVWDNDFTNNGTVSDAPIASAKVSIIDGNDGSTVKAVIYLGTPVNASAGEVQVYDEASQAYQGDWKAFGTGTGEVDPSILLAGDIIEYQLFTEDLDISNPATPQIASGAVAVASYQDTLLYAPSTSGLYPQATAATLTAMDNFTLGNSLTIGWSRASGTLSDEVSVVISDTMGNRVEVWDRSFSPDATSTTIASSELDATAASNAGLDANAASYSLLVRIYTRDQLTGQAHSTDYTATIPGPAATGGSGGSGTGSGFSCNYESGWDDTAYGGLGAPVTPNSFADYEAVIADCGSAMTFNAADVAGNTFQEIGTTETMTFNAGTGTASNPASGVYNDGAGFTITFQWWVEAATCTSCNYNYLVVYSDTTIDSNLPMSWLRETSALTGISGTQLSFVKYSEQSSYSDTNRASGSDGEIWNSVDEQL